jgi:hypothetical protein
MPCLTILSLVGTGRHAAANLTGDDVFLHVTHADKATINPLDFGQRTFYVLPTEILDSRTDRDFRPYPRSLNRSKLQRGATESWSAHSWDLPSEAGFR